MCCIVGLESELLRWGWIANDLNFFADPMVQQYDTLCMFVR
jgi:hypothetical protein